MIEWLKYRWRLNQLNRKVDKEEKSYSESMSKAKGEEKQRLHAEAGSYIVPLLEEISCLKSKRLCQIANRLIVPIPKVQEKPFWEYSHYTNGYYLSTEGINEVRKRIRQERLERCELVLKWIPAFVGIIGALIGLIAVMKK